MTNETPEIPKMRKLVINTPGLGGATRQRQSTKAPAIAKPVPKAGPKKAAVKAKVKPKASPKAKKDPKAEPQNTTAAVNGMDDTHTETPSAKASDAAARKTGQGAQAPRKRGLTPKEIKEASRKSSIRNKAAGGKRRSWGEPHPDLPFELYFRGQERARVLFTGPSRTLDAFNEYCNAHNFTKWEALELLMRRLGPDPKITEEDS